MANTRKWRVLLCAFAIVAAVLVAMFAITSCGNGNKKTTAITTTPDGPVGTTGPNSGDDGTTAVTTTVPPSIGAYNRTDVSGTPISATSSAGVNGNFSAYTSISGIVTLGDSIYVADETGKNVYKLSSSGAVQAKYTSTKQVNNIVTDGTNIYALVGGLDGDVVKLGADLKAVSAAEVGHTPSDMAIHNGKGYAVNRFSNTVSIIDLSTMKVSATVEIDGREPIAATVAGSDVYVACHLPDESTNESVMSANVAVISTSTGKVTKVLPLVNGASGVKDICTSPDGKTVYVSHIIGRYAYPTTQLDRGWINTNGFTIIDATKAEVYTSVLLDEVDHGAANPWGITVSSDGKYLCVALSGLNEVMIVNISKMNTKINSVKNGKGDVASIDKIVDYLPFLDGARERVTVGAGVRSITEKDGVLYCGLYFDGAVDTVKLSDHKVTRVKFVDQPEASEVRLGMILWSDANNCYQKWESCNSCHPDAVVDGFNWDNLNDGLGNGKSAKSMLYSHRTPPVMVTGIRPNAEIAVAAGMKFIQFNTLDSESLACIDEYLKSLYPIESPALNRDGTLTSSAQAGEALFNTNCASCHPAPLYTDLKLHNIGSSTLEREDGNYDTPTLIEVWRTAPYMHDGTLNTLTDAVKYHLAKINKTLSETEIKNLSDYVASICGVGELYGVEQVKANLNGTTSYNMYVDGATLTSVVVRCQSEDAPKGAVVALNVYDKNGKQVYYTDCAINGGVFNSTVVITLSGSIVLPEDGSYTVTIYSSETGNKVSSTLTIK